MVNIVSEWFVKSMNFTCGDFDRGIDEMALAGLTPVPSLRVRPPRVGESAVQLECRVRQIIPLEDRWGGDEMSAFGGSVIV